MKHTIIECDMCGDVILRDFWTRLQKGTVSVRTKELTWVLDAAHYDLYTKHPAWVRRKYHFCPKCVERIKTVCRGGARMKTPEEIKKGLSGCADKGNCEWCNLVLECEKNSDTLDYIQQLEQRLAQAERERDACVKDLGEALNRDGLNDCYFCKHKLEKCPECKWEWRGICEENSP